MKYLKRLLLMLCVFMLYGCTLKEDFNDTYLYTTLYPVEYAASSLYSSFAKINSVYPNGADAGYKVTNKKKDKYAEGEIFIYSGLANEATLAKDLLNINEKIKIIDATKGMNLNTRIEEIWLDPSNFLMLCSNIKNSLSDYNETAYNIKKSIEENYDILNEKISELDVVLYNLGKNGNYDTILTTSSVFNYLTKYNITVVSIDKNQETIDKQYADAKKLIKDKKVEYIYVLDGEELNETQEKFITDNELVKITINNLNTLTDDERSNGETYLTLMYKIIEEYKRELFKN